MGSASTSERIGQSCEFRNPREELSVCVHSETAVPGQSRVESVSRLNLFQKLLVYPATIVRLGIVNVARVAVHRTFKRLGIYKWLLPALAGAPLELRVVS